MTYGAIGKQTSKGRQSSCLLAAFVFLVCGCGHGGPIDVATADRVPIDLGKNNEERLLRYYLGGYVSPDGGDPVDAGLILMENGLAVNPQRIGAEFRGSLEDSDGDGNIGWDEFVVFIEATYADARSLPRELDVFRSESDWSADTNEWFTVDVDGVMTDALRRVYVQTGPLRAALEGFRTAEERILYEPGTLFVAEHLVEGRVVETTLKRRRSDGFWDFAVYDAEGLLTTRTATGPKELRAPVQCVGCHLGQRTYNPERSFPARAPDGPFGPRALYVNENLRNAEVTAFFDEHSKRSDSVLGLYATLYSAQLVVERQAGTIKPEDAQLLGELGL